MLKSTPYQCCLTCPIHRCSTCWRAGKSFKDENRLALFALEQQALVGSCTEPKPWGWNVVESAKWQAWSQLQDMAPVEAMRLYVRLLEDELVSFSLLLHKACALPSLIPPAVIPCSVAVVQCIILKAVQITFKRLLMQSNQSSEISWSRQPMP